MRVTYTAPVRGSHYIYARALERAGCLHAFVSGFSRFSPRAPLPEVGKKLLRADHLQNFYLASLALRLPEAINDELAYQSKVWLDRMSEKAARDSDLFLFYSGTGLRTATRLASTKVVRVVEAVNSHILVQERIVREEHRLLGLPPAGGFHRRDLARRVREYEMADAILCPSQFVRESFAQEGIPRDRLFVVPYGASVPQGTLRSRLHDETFRVLYVGQISVRKGLCYLFDAFERLQHPKKELWIVGPHAKETGIAGIRPPDQTRFLGVLKGRELEQAYQDSTVFVLPTIEEGLAHVLGEALSFGLPVVTTVNSGGADLFQDGREGYLVPIRSPEALAEKLQQLADDPEARERMSIAARARAQSLGGWETTVGLLIDTLTFLVKRSR